MKSIKTKIIVSIIVCTLLSAIPVGFMSLRNVYQTSNQGAEQELALKCQNEQEQINAQISKIEQSVDTLSSIAMNKLDFSVIDKILEKNDYSQTRTIAILVYGFHYE